MNIHFIRHGRTEANERGLYYGSTDLPLTERGVEELKKLKMTVEYPIAEIHLASDLRRTHETLHILYGKEPERTIVEFNEFDFGDFEMKTYEELRSDPDFIHWVSSGDDAACPGGESQNRFVERILRGFDILQHLGKRDVVLVCHGGVIGTLMDLLFPSEKDHYYAWVPDCGLGYTVELSAGKPVAYSPIE